MMSTLIEYSGVLIGVAFATLPALLDDRRADGRIDWFSKKNLLSFVLGFLSIVSGLAIVHNNDIDKDKADQKIDSLHNEVRLGSRTLANVKYSQDKFEKVLLEKFNIKKDPITNQPKKINLYNTNIDKAQTVNIGNNY